MRVHCDPTEWGTRMLSSEMRSETFGMHLMLDCYGADPSALAASAVLRAMMMEVVERLSMHQIHDPVVVEVGPKNRKDPGGLSGFLLIAESHISFHTFPKRGFVTIDVYTCQNSIDTEMIVDVIARHIKHIRHDMIVQPRGTTYPSKNVVD